MSPETFLKYPLVFLAAFILTYLLVPPVKRMAVACGVMDLPGERRLNERPVPRAGGVAVYFGFQLGCLLVFTFPWQLKFGGSLSAEWWLLYTLGATLLLLIGLADDAFNLNWAVKLSAQIVAAAIMFRGGISVGHFQSFDLPPTLDFLCTILWFLALTNAFNLVDGLDGLATGLALIAALGLTVAAIFRAMSSDALVLLALCGACLAFLRYNFHPAKIFLGDSGSLTLGFTLAAIALPSSTKGTTVAAIGVPLLAAGVPIFDTALAVWRRSVRAMTADSRSKGVMRADMDHLHHRLMHIGFTQRGVALWLYSINLLLVLIGLLSLVYHAQALSILIIAVVMGSYVMVRHLARVELWDSGAAFLRGLRRPSRPMLAAILYPAFDAAVLALATAAALGFTREPGTLSSFRREWVAQLPLWCGIPFICLFLTGIYSRVWSRARISEFLLLAICLFAAASLSLAIELIGNEQSAKLLLQAMIFLGLAETLILGLRAFPRTVLDLMGVFEEPDSANNPQAINVLIYGAGYHGILYLKQRTFSRAKAQSGIHIVGFVDDDLNLRKRLVHGYRVYGSSAELAQMVEGLQIGQIVIACRLPAEKKNKLLQFAKIHGLTVSEWQAQESTLYAAQAPEAPAAAPKVAQVP